MPVLLSATRRYQSSLDLSSKTYGEFACSRGRAAATGTICPTSKKLRCTHTTICNLHHVPSSLSCTLSHVTQAYLAATAISH